VEEKYIMKKKTVFSALAAGAVVMGLLLGTSMAQAEDVIFDPNDADQATGITNLDIGGTLYNVDFISQTTALSVYGAAPGVYDFPDTSSAGAAVDAVNAALNAANADDVGSAGLAGTEVYSLGFGFVQPLGVDSVQVWEGEIASTGTWKRVTDSDLLTYQFDERTYADFTVAGDGPPPSGAAVAASSLPSSRSVQIGSVASAFATVINTSNTAATDCSIAPQTSVAADFAYQTTDASNALVGTPNTPTDIAAGGSQNFIFAFTPTATFSPTEVLLNYDCTNSVPAPVTVGLNTLLLSASATPVPDIVALAATPTGDGIVDLPGTNGSNAFSVATVNVGSTDTITASATPSVTLPLSLSICETNPATGACLSAPASSTTSSVSGGATPTYSIFVTGAGTVPFDPANNRINVEFKDAGAVTRGSTSVAVRTL